MTTDDEEGKYQITDRNDGWTAKASEQPVALAAKEQFFNIKIFLILSPLDWNIRMGSHHHDANLIMSYSEKEIT